MALVSLADAAERLNLSSSTLRHQIRNKRFRAHKIGRDWVTTDAEIERYRRDNKMDEAMAEKYRHRARKEPDESPAEDRDRPKPKRARVR